MTFSRRKQGGRAPKSEGGITLQSEDAQRKAHLVAVLHYSRGLQVTEIAEMLGLEKTRISRLLAAAEKHGFVRHVFEAPSCVSLEAAVLDRCRSRVKFARVLPTIGRMTQSPRSRGLTVEVLEQERHGAVGGVLASLLDTIQGDSTQRPESTVCFAVGGSRIAYEAARSVPIRQTAEVTVVPTALTRHGASASALNPTIVATVLASRWSAIQRERAMDDVELARSSLLVASVSPWNSTEDFGRWKSSAMERQDVQAVASAWSKAAVVVISGVPLERPMVYRTTGLALENLGTSLDTLIADGVGALIANRFFRSDGSEYCFPRSGDSTFELAMPCSAMQRVVASPHGRGWGIFVGLGKCGIAAAVAIRAGISNALIIDEEAAEALLKEMGA